MAEKIFVSAIDTGVGKTIASGLIAKKISEKGKKVITFKLVQTGCSGISEDIIKHREIMEIPLTEDDLSGLTCPYVFKHPCSPHLAAKLEEQTIHENVITNAISELEKKYDFLIIEGVGGLFVPINESLNIIDFIKKNKYPLALITTTKLGSINHTLMSLELLIRYNIPLKYLILNKYFCQDKLISKDTETLFRD